MVHSGPFVRKEMEKKHSFLLKPFVEIVDKNFDPYSISIRFDELSNQLIDGIIRAPLLRKSMISLQIVEIISELESFSFSFYSLADLVTVINKSPAFSRRFLSAQRELADIIGEFFLEWNYDLSFVFVDFGSKTFQITNIEKWNQNKKVLEEQISTLKLKDEETVKKGSISISEDQLTEYLRDAYFNSPLGYQMASLHLFGIKFRNSLSSTLATKIARKVTGKISLGVEIMKGVKIGEFVRLNNSPFTPFNHQPKK